MYKALIALLFLTSMEFVNTNQLNVGNNNRGILIEPDIESISTYKSGDVANFKGSICMTRVKQDISKMKCHRIKNDAIVVSGYFPDPMTPVPIELVYDKKTRRYHYDFSSDVLNSNNQNLLSILVGKPSDKTYKYFKIKAKIAYRLEKIDRKIAKYTNHHKKSHLIPGLLKIRELLFSTEQELEEHINKDPFFIAKLEQPIMVEREVKANGYYSSVFNGMRLEYTSSPSVSIEGTRSTTVTTKITNQSLKRFKVPKLKDEVNEESGDIDRLDKFYNIEYYLNEELIKEELNVGIGFDESHEVVHENLQFTADSNNEFMVVLKVITKKKIITWAAFKQTFKVFKDNTAPLWEGPVTPNINRLVTRNLEDNFMTASILDHFGEIDLESLTVQVNGVEKENILQVTPDPEDEKYIVTADSIFDVDGIYEIRFSGKDKAGNLSIPNELVRTIVLDRESPVISTSVNSGLKVNSANLATDITVEDLTDTITKVYLNEVEIQESEEDNFTVNLDLEYGVNTITVESTDSAGNERTIHKLENIIFDNNAPTASFLAEIPSSQDSRFFSAVITIEDLLSTNTKIFHNSNLIMESSNKQISLNSILSIGYNTFEVESIDELGNQLNRQVLGDIEFKPVPLEISSNLQSPYYTGNESIEVTYNFNKELISMSLDGQNVVLSNKKSYSAQIDLIEGKKSVSIVAKDEDGVISSKTFEYIKDSEKPVISCNELRELTNQSHFSLSCSVVDTSDLEFSKVVVNGSTLYSSFEKQIEKEILLTEGDNLILVEVKDISGNLATFSQQVLLDTTVPAVTNLTPENNSNSTEKVLALTGTISEPLAEFFINDKPVVVQNNSFATEIIFDSIGEKQISIKATDIAGNSSDLYYVYTVTAPAEPDPEMEITVTEQQNGSLNFTLDASKSTDDSYISKYEFIVIDSSGNSQTFEENPVSFAGVSQQNYDVTLIITDSSGVQSMLTKRLFVNDTNELILISESEVQGLDSSVENLHLFPNANVSPRIEKPNMDVIFDGSSSISLDADIHKYIWSFGDSFVKEFDQPIAVHSYTEEGDYEVTLTIVDVNNISKTVQLG